MKKFSGIIIFTLAFCVVSFAQSQTVSSCPSVEVNGPSDIPRPDEPVIFTATLSKNTQNYPILYEWTISSGEIIEGQGTATIKVLQEEPGSNTTAAVVIKGLPEICGQIVASETVACILRVQFRLIDSFSIKATQISKISLDDLAVELRNDPNAMAYIFEKFRRGTSENSIKQKLEKIFAYLEDRFIEKNRIVIQTSFSDRNETLIYIVPAGADAPTRDEN